LDNCSASALDSITPSKLLTFIKILGLIHVYIQIFKLVVISIKTNKCGSGSSSNDNKNNTLTDDVWCNILLPDIYPKVDASQLLLISKKVLSSDKVLT
jgi:hypothetical protein